MRLPVLGWQGSRVVEPIPATIAARPTTEKGPRLSWRGRLLRGYREISSVVSASDGTAKGTDIYPARSCR